MAKRLRDILGSLLATLSIAAWTMMSLLPTGTVLCLGGDGCLEGTIAARCDQAPRCRTDFSPSTEDASKRPACPHHDGHDDDTHKPPCTDIPAAEHVARDRGGDRSQELAQTIAILPTLGGGPSPGCLLPTWPWTDLQRFALPDRGAPPELPRQWLISEGGTMRISATRALRAVILQL